MNLLNPEYYFERSGDRFVYRPTIFSAGFSLSSGEKDRLFEEIKRLERRFLIEGLSLIALVAGMFMAGILTSPTPIPWFLLMSVGAVALLSVTVIHRKRRVVEIALGRRAADVPRMPIRQALTRPRPVLARRYAIPILRSVIGLFLLATVIIDVLALSPIVAALLPQDLTDGRADGDAIAEALSHTLYSATYWAAVALINVLLLACARLLAWEVRRIRALPDRDDPGGDTSCP